MSDTETVPTSEVGTVPPVGTRIRFKQGSWKDHEAVVIAPASHQQGGLVARVFDEDGSIAQDNYYVLSAFDLKSSGGEFGKWAEVLPSPLPKYALVRYKATPEARGIVVAQDGDEVTVMRVGEHLGVGTQDWKVDAIEVDPDPPTVTAKQGDYALGSRVVFTSGPYAGLRATIIGKSSDGYTAFLCDEDCREQFFAVGPEAFDPDETKLDKMFSPGAGEFALVDDQGKPKLPTGNKSKDGQPIYVGDLLEYIPGNSNWKGVQVRALPIGGTYRYEFVTLPQFPDHSYKVGDPVNLTASDLRHVPEPDATADEGIGLVYSDGVPIKVGDRIVYNPGWSLAGKTATVVGEYNGQVEVAPDDKTVTAFRWTVARISRLQDEDKEKLSDDPSKPQGEALALFRDLMEQAESLKDDLDSAVSTIESELSSAESNEPPVEFDTSDIQQGISIGTDASSLIDYFSVSNGEVSVDDEAVDSHALDSLSVDESYITATVDTSGWLEDLHNAIAEGKETLDQLLEVVAKMSTVASAAFSEAEVGSKVITPGGETYEGTIHNARFGVVLPEDADSGPTLRFDVVTGSVEQGARRVRLAGRQIGAFMSTVGVSDVKHLEGRTAKVTEDGFGGWYPTAVSEV